MPAHQKLDSLHEAASGIDLPAKLTAKETQALLWCLKGKTSWEIARIQNCSVSTINFHFSNIRRKFAVSSRRAALLKAIEVGVISLASSEMRGLP
jgi:LuxR family quorum-sensing transcriptional regulator LasR